ncbi:MAG: helix-turn-helix domain-containing protein [bacterium]|nr:helix-turn-helix domain-containing protein [bacterium]
MPFPIKSRRRSPASLLLDHHGIPQTHLAETLGVSQSSLSRVLAGRQPAPNGLALVLRTLVGIDAADEILAAIKETTP